VLLRWSRRHGGLPGAGRRAREYGIVLLPESRAEQEFISVSHSLAQLAVARLRLDRQTCHPHVTIANFRATSSAAHAVWDQLTDQVTRDWVVDAHALYLLPTPVGVWAGVNLVRSTELEGLHRRVSSAIAATGLSPGGPIAEFWPHLTLTLWERPPAARLPLSEACIGEFHASMALADIGDHGTVRSLAAQPETLHDRSVTRDAAQR
jgi:2'-5' RNA ligase